MRIVAGRWRGRTLTAPSGDATRPTADRVREALFSMLASRLGSFEDLRVVDLFAGTGALGLEALSRGAAHATFVETDRRALAALKANIATLGADAAVLAMPAAGLGRAPEPAHLAFLDPPYGKGLAGPALERLRDNGWLAPHALVSVETARDEAFPLPAGFTLDTTRDHGKARLHILRVEG
ncbi:MAG: 16S rRNA (guanine(966)-N(2))-methyltransferase RsmD [Alphaproteobacteria bacterium]|nr:16S rRNA (guanine(966)-N(2))-methyltransferase RsmD [Alphaproteobacteria bacterium]